MDIPRDSKDWTWVLREPCPECGFDATAIPREAFGDLVAGSVGVWVDALDEPTAAQRSDPQAWSVLEYACHVRDVHGVFNTRLRDMLAEHDPIFANWDQDQTAIDDDYATQDPGAVSQELVAAAEAMLATIDGLEGAPEATWQRPGRRSNGSAFTVDSLIRYYLHDVVHHEWDIT